MKLTSSIVTLGLLLGATGCSSTLAQPFEQMKAQPITIYRLQNYEPPQAAGAAGAPAMVPAIPPQIQQWLTAGAQMLPPGLLPPGLIPGTGAAAPSTDDPRFHNFRILGSTAIADKTQREEVLDLFGHNANFETPRQSCMFAEFGFRFGYEGAPGTQHRAPGARRRAGWPACSSGPQRPTQGPGPGCG